MTGPSGEHEPAGPASRERPARRGAGWSGHPATAAVLVRSADPRRLAECAFVLGAVGIESEVRGRPGDQLLLVPVEDALRAEEHLRRYAEENRARDLTVVPQAQELAPARAGVVAAVLLLLLVFVAQQRGLGGLDWEGAGRNEAAAVRDGQWWRAVTALTLHADVPHLAGNLVFGAAFGFLVAQLLGNGLGWCAIVLAGALGNLAGAWVRPPGQASLGASTAVFAAVGLLVAAALRLAGRAARGRLQRWAPLALGLALLGYLGTSGERTDLLAHVLGLLAGIGSGLPLFRPDRPRPGRAGQLAWGAAALLLVLACWGAALTRTR